MRAASSSSIVCSANPTWTSTQSPTCASGHEHGRDLASHAGDFRLREPRLDHLDQLRRDAEAHGQPILRAATAACP